MTNKNTLHIHKWETFESVIFEDAALRAGDHVTCELWGKGEVKEVFWNGKGKHCLVNFFDAGTLLVRREDMNLGEDGWLADATLSGAHKRIRHDKELRKLLDAQVWKTARR
ncbi:MAG: hypothetical protein CMB52_05410 [Euryarchaeota archaeon]|nr:hypothetical protein [Euryarchaeota archaeon]MBJ84934.1 hypothetical protein [Euryarchaeota archaeon]|tara:strand:- start:7051 stop:7383 length:333 start_codon:yes stop_codon:yes gene_type:complete